MASSTAWMRCAIWVSSSASMVRRAGAMGCPAAKLTPPPKRRSAQAQEASAGGSLVSVLSAGGWIASAASACITPWPIFSSVSASFIRGVDFCAEAKRAWRTASMRIQGWE